METGTVRWFNIERGFGFVAPDNGGEDLFVHYSAIASKPSTLNENDRVEYEIAQGPRGLNAVNVKKVI